MKIHDTSQCIDYESVVMMYNLGDDRLCYWERLE